WLESPLGPLVAAASNHGICLLEFTDRRMLETQFRMLKKLFGCSIVPGENAHLKTLKNQLEQYFAGRLKQFSVPVVCPGTPFQERVWKELQRIPFGETHSYEDLARRIGAENA